MKILSRAVPAAVALLMAGCASNPCRSLSSEQRFVWQTSQWPVRVLAPNLEQVIGVQDVSTARTGSGMAAVQASVCNATDRDVVLLMRTRFSGERGESEPPSAWRTVFLAPRSQAAYGESAVSAATRRMSVEIHDANRGQQQLGPGQWR